jgi:ribosome biogenesis GTPase / thiamine phosphate phosphatase
VPVAPTTLTLPQLGWSDFFDEQLTAQERRTGVVGRIFAVQRSGVTVVFPGGSVELPLGGRWFKLPSEGRPTIGDWVLLDASRSSIERLLERKSVLRRVAAGRERELQLMAANVDTMFLVSSCNEEFNPSRLERYLALALDAGVEPVVVLTKADLAADPDRFVREVRTLKRDLAVEFVDARDPRTLVGVRARCQPGQTVALLGSSGVGKSTLVNSLSGAQVQLTQASREDDAKGRHTTTGRSLHVLPDGGLLVDNPGMRELLLADVDVTAAQVFDDVDALAAACRFRNCRHVSEPGCAVRAAIDSGALDVRRLESYRKLATEEAHRTRTLTENRTRPEGSKRQRHVADPPEE